MRGEPAEETPEEPAEEPPGEPAEETHPDWPEGADRSEILAQGPWELDRIRADWSRERFEPGAEKGRAADQAIRALQERGAPSHDGVAARLVGYEADREGLMLRLQPTRWSLRLVPEDASQSLSALCVTRSADGCWLAGRRARWLASWAGHWTLGAGGAVDLEENPGDTLVRELQEEWSVLPARVRGELLLGLPHEMVMLVGQAWLPPGAQVVPDAEHDTFAWWPADVEEWPQEGHGLRGMARWLARSRL